MVLSGSRCVVLPVRHHTGDGLLWEHYTTNWEHDWSYNRERPTHLYRPWGYQPGHLMEWTKLLL